ncbi:MAG: autotransporter outer membrane beta-barrel domain-containing protein [Pseudomonadota bacterium]
MQKKLAIRPACIAQFALPALMFCLADVQAISLDKAVNLQLENTPGGGPCARLLTAGAVLTGSLETICARAVPVGSTPSTTGGGSATPTANPNADSGLLTAAQKSAKPKHELSANSGQWNFFLTAENESLDRNASLSEGGFDSSLDRLVLGTSYLVSANTAFSIALNMSKHNGDFQNGGDFSFDTKGLRLLGSFKPTEKLSVQLAAAYDDVAAKRQRIASFNDLFNNASIFAVNGKPLADYTYNQLGLSARTAYEFNVGRLSFSPQIGVDWSNSAYDTYSERGNSGLELSFHNDAKKSLQTTLGFLSSFAVGTSYGAFIPQFSASWRHELESDARNIKVSFTDDTEATKFAYQTDALDADFFELSAGSVFVFKNGTQAFVNVQTLVGNDQYDSFIASAGMRFEL